MRTILALPLLLVGACNVDNDPAEDRVTVEYNEQRIRDAAQDARTAAEDVASSVGNVAASTGRAIKNEVGDVDVDVDVDVNRNRSEKTN